MGTQITFRRGSTDPTSGSGITLAEPVFNTNLHTFHIGLGYGVTAEWVGAPISGLSADIAAGITYKIPTAAAVKNYISGLCFGNTAGGGGGGAVSSVSGSGNGVLVSPTTGAVVVSNTGVHSFNGLTGAVQGVSAAVAGDGIAVSGATGAVTITNTGVTRAVAGTGISVSGATGSVTITNTGVQSFNGLTGAVQGVSAAVAGTGISVSGATGAVTITNIGVQSFNGRTGAVTGASLGANTFTELNTFNAGISASGATFSSLVSSSGGFSGNVNISSANTGTMYLAMARGAGVTALFVDDTTTPLVYQPFQGNLGLKGFTLSSGTDVLYATPTQITATSTSAPESAYFYFVSPTIYFQSGNTAAMATSGSTRQLTWGDIATNTSNCYFGVNRASDGGMCGDYAVEINHSTGKALQLIYNDYTGAASNWVNMDVSSGGNYTLRPSGGLATVTGTLNVSAGVCAAGATFSGNISAPNIVTSFNGVTGAVTGVSRVNGFTGGITLAAGTGITFTASSGTITLAASGGSNSTTQTLDFSENINKVSFTLTGLGGDISTSLAIFARSKTEITQLIVQAGVTAYYPREYTYETKYNTATGEWFTDFVIKQPFPSTISGTTSAATAEQIVTTGIGYVTIDYSYYDESSNAVFTSQDNWTGVTGTYVHHQDATYVVKTVTGQSWVAAGSYIECKVLGLTTADHTPEDAILEGVRFEIDNIVAGTGFDIIGHAPEGTYGKYSVKCLGQ